MIDPFTLIESIFAVPSTFFGAGFVGWWLHRRKNTIYKERWEEASRVIDAKPSDNELEAQVHKLSIEKMHLGDEVSALRAELKSRDQTIQQLEEAERRRQDYLRGLRDGAAHSKRKENTVELPLPLVMDESLPETKRIYSGTYGGTYVSMPSASYMNPHPFVP